MSRSVESEQALIGNTERFVRAALEHDRTGHDWWHISRVVQMADKLAEAEGADPFICRMASLVHDVADEKLNESKESGLHKVNEWLTGQPLSVGAREHIMDIIATMSYNGGNNPPMRTLEGQVVQDADRLDAIGAIAIARTFLYAGVKGHPIYDPELAPREKLTPEQYRSSETSAVNHFYEKLLKLKDLMNTESGRRMAENRHQFMSSYLEQFHKEWEGAG